MNTKKISRIWFGLMISGLLLILIAPLHAATGYEVSNINLDPSSVLSGQFVKLDGDLTVSWAPPADDTQVMKYILKFYTESTSLTEDQFNVSNADFSVSKGGLFQVIPKSFFAEYDSNQIRYLHVKTQYATLSGYAYSDDVVFPAPPGDIRIDNVAPTGTLTLNPTSGSTNVINVSMSPTESIKYYWLNDGATFPGGTGTVYTDFPQGAVGLREGTPYGTVKIYAWFEDFAGNRSTAASATADYNYTASVAIQYNSPSVAVDASLPFTVDGTTSYNWTITDPSVPGVAEFSGGGTGPVSAASVTVVGKKAGTFTVTAKLSETDPDPLKTGTITVVESYLKGDADGSGTIDATDALYILHYVAGNIPLNQLMGNCDVDNSGSIDATDALYVLHYVAGNISSFD